jgi:alkanesulfonate monooxygenase SsuD/methylene tetrahydromethanopterin reductase-like flavin-dependent oxidoreductase (luciferase family)
VEERAVWAEQVRATFAEKRSRGELPGTPEQALEELERDAHAGRDVKFDLRLAPDEKVAWSEQRGCAG